MMDFDDFSEGIQPDNDVTEEDLDGGLLFKALILLFIMLIPLIAAGIQLFQFVQSGGLSNTIETIRPILENTVNF